MTARKPRPTPHRRILTALSSRTFFRLVLALLILQAAWIALSGLYPMAFDEGFHLGLIRVYSHHLNPFLSGQPTGADSLGAVARDPSYLYHYLMSFPYRLVDVFTHDLATQVLVLRAINIGLFASGLVLWRRLLLRTRASSAAVNLSMLVFVLIPVVPLLAAQINYDNLLFGLVALALMWTLDIGSGLAARRRVSGTLLLALVILCLLTGLVKYAFLPILVAIAVYLAVKAYRSMGGWRAAWQAVRAGLASMQRRTLILMTAAAVLALLLAGQRYGINLVRYHTPDPDCGRVLSVQHCKAYGPWYRNYLYQAHETSKPLNPLPFDGSWFYGMWLRMFFAVDGPGTRYQTRGPLTVPGVSAIVFTAAGVILVAAYGRRVFRRYDAEVLSLAVLTATLYIAALWLDQFSVYMRIGHVVAINGRYLFPVLLPLILIGTLAAGEFLRRRKGAERLRLIMAAVGVLSLVWGGGALTYILRSNDAWYWNNDAVRSTNHAVQDTLGPVTPGYRHPVQFLR